MAFIVTALPLRSACQSFQVRATALQALGRWRHRLLIL
ncbi:hypothetical protein ApDm4_1855 [Acetobacter pomorum]|nr:hypothetical protein ApDm4_1855 [Acetobacter pomorum]